MTECWWVVGSLLFFNWSPGNLSLIDREEEEDNENHSTIPWDKANLWASDKPKTEKINKLGWKKIVGRDYQGQNKWVIKTVKGPSVTAAAAAAAAEGHLAYQGWCVISLPAELKWAALSGTGQNKKKEKEKKSKGKKEADGQRGERLREGKEEVSSSACIPSVLVRARREPSLRHCHLLRQQHVTQALFSQAMRDTFSSTRQPPVPAL